MMALALNAASFVLAFVLMEPVAWATHRYIMHGPLWALHRSHHRSRSGVFEANDLFVIFFAGVAIALFAAGAAWGVDPLFWAGAGTTAYGAAYALAHDGMAHQRFGRRLKPRGRYLRRLVQAHRLHHAVHTRQGAVSFGFLHAPDVRRLKMRLADQGVTLTP